MPPMALRVSAPARLHLGLIDLRGDLGRLFGSLGVALATPRLVLTARAAPQLVVHGGGVVARRVEAVARSFLDRYAPGGTGAHLEVEAAIPAHVGLGSGTQIALATGTALARLCGLAIPTAELAVTLGRGRRSGIGTAAFERGGFAVDGGRRNDRAGSPEAVPPLIAWHPIPAAWRFVVAIPPGEHGLSGRGEESAFRVLPRPDEAVVGRICRLLVMQVLPALVEADIGPCGTALTEIQALVGDCFAPLQGGRYATPRRAGGGSAGRRRRGGGSELLGTCGVWPGTLAGKCRRAPPAVRRPGGWAGSPAVHRGGRQHGSRD
jgi:beta-ribofuranosylaminobenzene 5'-phosphate synthase